MKRTSHSKTESTSIWRDHWRALLHDHGTGVVVGETTVIGKNVKLYQGVTLGALSFPRTIDRHADEGAQASSKSEAMSSSSRATILADPPSDMTPNRGNVWLMDSIPPFSRGSTTDAFHRVKTGRMSHQKTRL